MLKFEKITDKHNEYDIVDVCFTIEKNGVCLEELCEVLTQFIKACGYEIDGKTIQLMEGE